MGNKWMWIFWIGGGMFGFIACQRGEWLWGLAAIGSVVLSMAFQAWQETVQEEEAKEERMEMKRMELENQRVIELQKAERDSKREGHSSATHP